MNSMADLYGVSDVTMRRWLDSYSIEIRPFGQSVSIAQTGKPHTQEHRDNISAAHIARGSWSGKSHPVFLYPEKIGSKRGKGGRRADLNNLYVRSSWEANVARYLNFLVDRGQVLKWEYEPDCFEFTKIKRGSKFYTPDFKVTELDGSYEYWEVKGYMDEASKTKLDRMARYYPEIKIVVIDKQPYKAIAKLVAGMIPCWEGAKV